MGGSGARGRIVAMAAARNVSTNVFWFWQSADSISRFPTAAMQGGEVGSRSQPGRLPGLDESNCVPDAGREFVGIDA